MKNDSLVVGIANSVLRNLYGASSMGSDIFTGKRPSVYSEHFRVFSTILRCAIFPT